MLLNSAQLHFFRENGYLLLENYFSTLEIDILTSQLPAIFGEDSPRRILEKSGAVRTVFAPHTTNEIFLCLSRLRRLVEPAQQLLESDVYIHQFKINAKVALEGDRWEWHQDFLYWHKEDGMPTPRVVTAALFLQDVDEFNGPMLLVPGSHREGIIDTIPFDQAAAPAGAANTKTTAPSASWMPTLTADLKYKIDKATLAPVMNKHGLMSVKGRGGLVVFFDGNMLHASGNNLSAHDRISVFISYNSIENTPHEVARPRPLFLASRDFSRVVAVEDTALLSMGNKDHEG